MSEQILISPDKLTIATINQGQLISLKVNDIEIMHQREIGWGKTDDEMFPIVGPTDKNNYIIRTKKGDGILDQHGLLRELDYELIEHSGYSTIYQKTYTKDTQIVNSKYKDNHSRPEYLTWPYSFTFRKIFSIENNKLIIKFEIESEKEMPFMFGYHPAFKLTLGESQEIITPQKNNPIQIKSVFDQGNIAYLVLKSTKIELKDFDKVVTMKAQGFENFMLWTPELSMVCIEPITFYPYSTENTYSHECMRKSNGIDSFQIEISTDLK